MCKVRDLITKSADWRYHLPNRNPLIQMRGYVGVVREGLVVAYSLTPDGDSVLIQLANKGKLLNVCGDPEAVFYAVSPSAIQTMPQRHVNSDDPEILKALLHESQEFSRNLIDRNTNLVGKPVVDQVKWAIAALEAVGWHLPPSGPSPYRTLPLIAGLIDADQSTISRALKKLRCV